MSAISLSFAPHLRVAGESIAGHVDLHFPALTQDDIEEVHVKLRGSVFTKITRSNGQSSSTARQHVPLLRHNISLWSRSAPSPPYPTPPSTSLRLPFTFTLPHALPPSTQYSAHNKSGIVGYSLEVVGVRSGLLRFNRRVLRPFPLVPADEPGAAVRVSLSDPEGWAGAWRSWKKAESVRQGIWGAYGKVAVELALPDIPTLPLFTRIPFTLTVVTHTKPLHHIPSSSSSSSSSHTGAGQIFPAPPRTPADVVFRLDRRVAIRARRWNADGFEHLGALGGMGVGVGNGVGGGRVGGNAARGQQQQQEQQERAEVVLCEKTWVPERRDGPGKAKNDEKNANALGRWKCETTFTGAVLLKCPPTVEAETMKVAYFLHLKVPVPGLGNDLKMDVPVRVSSGSLSRVSADQPSSSLSSSAWAASGGAAGEETLPAYEGPPPERAERAERTERAERAELDLPPAYFSAAGWEADEKA